MIKIKLVRRRFKKDCMHSSRKKTKEFNRHASQIGTRLISIVQQHTETDIFASLLYLPRKLYSEICACQKSGLGVFQEVSCLLHEVRSCEGHCGLFQLGSLYPSVSQSRLRCARSVEARVVRRRTAKTRSERLCGCRETRIEKRAAFRHVVHKELAVLLHACRQRRRATALKKSSLQLPLLANTLNPIAHRICTTPL